VEAEPLQTQPQRLTWKEAKLREGQLHAVNVVMVVVVRSQKGHLASVMSGSVRSAGLVPFRRHDGVEVLVAHPGGPYFARRDNGWWSIVKGMVELGELDEATAAREFEEETGWAAPPKPWIPLGDVEMKSRKVVVAWAVEADYDIDTLDPGLFSIGHQKFPEIDRVQWMKPELARIKLNPAMGTFVDRLEQLLQG
jgi:predicted NUDIX family NTP pyrophosphohydrolase